jgi:hypothetical protein
MDQTALQELMIDARELMNRAHRLGLAGVVIMAELDGKTDFESHCYAAAGGRFAVIGMMEVLKSHLLDISNAS